MNNEPTLACSRWITIEPDLRRRVAESRLQSATIEYRIYHLPDGSYNAVIVQKPQPNGLKPAQRRPLAQARFTSEGDARTYCEASYRQALTDPLRVWPAVRLS